jgi:hypothetical protein
MCRGQNRQFQHGWNVSWSKSSVSPWLECVSWAKSSVLTLLECGVVVKIASFSMVGMLYSKKGKTLKIQNIL